MSFLLSVFRSDKSIIEGEFAGKTILLTGAGRGIGREIALELARCGAKTLLLGSLSELPLQETATQCRQQASHPDFEAFACPCDVSDRGSVQRMKTTFQTQQPSRSTLHYIITNAGVLGGHGMLDTDPDKWDRVFNVNFYGTVHVLREWLPLLVKTPKTETCGVVTVSSIMGMLGTSFRVPLTQPYTASKFAVIGLTQNLRSEMAMGGHTHVRVACVIPGHIGTNIALTSREAELRQEIAEGMSPAAPRRAVNFVQWLGYPVQDGATINHLKLAAADLFIDYAPVSASQCGRILLREVAKENPRIIIGFDSYFVDIMSRMFPVWSQTRLFFAVVALVVVSRMAIVPFVYRKPATSFVLTATLVGMLFAALFSVLPVEALT